MNGSPRESKNGSGPVYASNEDICVQSEFMRPMDIYASNKWIMSPNNYICVQSKSMRPIKIKFKKVKNFYKNYFKRGLSKILTSRLKHLLWSV